MRTIIFAKRNFKEIVRDPVSIILTHSRNNYI